MNVEVEEENAGCGELFSSVDMLVNFGFWQLFNDLSLRKAFIHMKTSFGEVKLSFPQGKKPGFSSRSDYSASAVLFIRCVELLLFFYLPSFSKLMRNTHTTYNFSRVG
jgi:hypothetical protein